MPTLNMMYSLALQLSFEKNMNQHAGNNRKGSNMKRSTTVATYHHRRGFAPIGSVGVRKGNISRSESDLAWQHLPKASVPQQTLLGSKSTHRKQTTTSQQIRRAASQVQPLHTVDGKSPTKTHTLFVCGSADVSKTSSKPPELNSKGGSGWVGSITPVFYDDDWFVYFTEHIVLPCSHCAFYLCNSGAAEITMVEAVEYLSRREDTFQHCGASYIQHRTFIDDKAKEEVVCLV